jgi:hypothetical protein
MTLKLLTINLKQTLNLKLRSLNLKLKTINIKPKKIKLIFQN